MKLEDLKDYKLVWSDEFDGNEIDPKKWCFNDWMGVTKKDGKITYDVATDERVAKVENGSLQLNVYYDEERDCFVGPVSLTTKETMSFVYGYLEMRARVPYTHGSWASFWAVGSGALNARPDAPYFTEVDFFEIEGGDHVAISNLHKWHYTKSGFVKEGQGRNDCVRWGKLPEETRVANYTPEDTEGFNLYKFYWTPEKMEVYVNDDLIGRFDINADFGRPSGTDGFHHPLFIIFNNYLEVPGVFWGSDAPTARVTPEDVKTQIPYEIDYIRLYQKDGEGELNLAQE